MENRVNAGYKIIQSLRLDPTHEIVIGHRPTAPSPYVVWDCKYGDSYDAGGYTLTYRNALEELADRLKRRYDFLPLEWEE